MFKVYHKSKLCQNDHVDIMIHYQKKSIHFLGMAIVNINNS